jgi:tetratricopeptide (TPR) repeat protein
VDNEVYKLSAAIALETGQIEQAEKDYLTALYMVPNRMRSRYDLMNFYLSARDTSKAINWGKSLLKMQVKIPTGTTKNLQQQTKNILQSLRKK